MTPRPHLIPARHAPPTIGVYRTVLSAVRASSRPSPGGCAITSVLIPAAAVVLVGAVSQRMTGLGFALIAAPLLTLMSGPYQGIVLANLLALLVAGSVLAVSWREVEPRRAAALVPFGLLGVLPGVWVARTLSAGPLQTVIGLLTLLGLAGAIWRVVRNSRADRVAGRDRTTGGGRAEGFGTGRPVPGEPAAAHGPKSAPCGDPSPHPALTSLAGAASGFMTATAGVGGPALTVYALATAWRQAGFAATAQLNFAGQAALALVLKDGQELPDPVECAVLLAAVGIGLALGHVLAGRVPDKAAHRAVIVIAVAGALATTVKGALLW
ncbi:sulfite exporter TauE/SafE family protein [Streptomyces edwardsiae]|uniref:Probable membrane transporter protein n=1 Tax=Streptomyces edwardsiae TaxID=3075527 RepID=A0ABU2QD44_9ACTN|nr:sulfite exporter TauE/SafE family protein [Streptomyces sp. DSM 41635]MDT0401794.1 sulfite exporter TauE/SafE family protein [Streptomyces sp. DSM 41635]